MTELYRLEIFDISWSEAPRPHMPKAIWQGERLVCDFTDDGETATLEEAQTMCDALNLHSNRQ